MGTGEQQGDAEEQQAGVGLGVLVVRHTGALFREVNGMGVRFHRRGSAVSIRICDVRLLFLIFANQFHLYIAKYSIQAGRSHILQKIILQALQ